MVVVVVRTISVKKKDILNIGLVINYGKQNIHLDIENIVRNYSN